MDIKLWPHKKGDGGLLCMPLVRNIPNADKERPNWNNWNKTTCPDCGAVCWISDSHKKILEQETDVKAVCTMCALKAGSRRL